MTYEIYRCIFYVCAVLAGCMCLASVLLFFLYKIPNVIGYLTGANERKAVESISNKNKSTSKHGNKMTSSGHSVRSSDSVLVDAVSTAKISTQELHVKANETTVLDNMNETVVLNADIGETTFEIEYEITFIHTKEVIV